MKELIEIKPYGPNAVILEWPAEISNDILNQVIELKNFLENRFSDFEIISAYNSILIWSDDNKIDTKTTRTILTEFEFSNNFKINSRIFEIPVCYDSSFGAELASMSENLNLSVEQIINLHHNTLYTVYFIGFLPGFLYLGGLDNRLFYPRKSIPANKIEKGSVAIGANQTGIYPMQSPGGWNIIGKTPINLFDPNNEEPCFASPGDKIAFKPIALDEFYKIKSEVELGNYHIKSELC